MLMSTVLHYIMWKVQVISRLLHQDDTLALVRKKAITEGSELTSYFLFDDKEIFDCLINLPCLTHKKKHQKCKKHCRSTDTNQHCCYHHCHHDTATNQHCHYHCCHHDVPADQCNLNLPEDMVEDNPLDIDSIKEKQDEDNR